MPSIFITLLRFICGLLSFALAAHFSDGAWHLFSEANEHTHHQGIQGNILAITYVVLGMWILLFPPSPFLPILAIILALAISYESLLTLSELNGTQYRAIILVLLTTVLIIVSRPDLDGEP